MGCARSNPRRTTEIREEFTRSDPQQLPPSPLPKVFTCIPASRSRRPARPYRVETSSLRDVYLRISARVALSRLGKTILDEPSRSGLPARPSTPAPPPGVVGGESSLVETFVRRAEERPERVAYRFLVDGEAEGPSLTYAELLARANGLAAWLAAAGA